MKNLKSRTSQITVVPTTHALTKTLDKRAEVAL